ncbi:MAG TPA: hypothetical protein PKJ63_11505 [Cyclobacteriaceae bacterium]|nr:hypothetical protein [Cyclobacteriaceae bacterium]
MKFFCCGTLFFCTVFSYAQVRMEKFVIRAGTTYELTNSDIMVIDTLIMQDSARIILNRAKADNFIHTKVFRIGNGCSIIGDGLDGENGETGVSGYTAVGPCKNGIPGRSGTRGTNAKPGVNLFIYADQFSIASRLLVELSGGDGGDGGRGGAGGGGSPGTRLCQGGNGGAGGNGAPGGNGANGGNLTISCKKCPDLRAWLGNKLVVRTYGGNGGLGGDGGLGGLAGLISSGSSKDGEQGPKGKAGESGEPGKTGAINFEQN